MPGYGHKVYKVDPRVSGITMKDVPIFKNSSKPKKSFPKEDAVDKVPRRPASENADLVPRKPKKVSNFVSFEPCYRPKKEARLFGEPGQLGFVTEVEGS
mgnify:CR=1 FL=1